MSKPFEIEFFSEQDKYGKVKLPVKMLLANLAQELQDLIDLNKFYFIGLNVNEQEFSYFNHFNYTINYAVNKSYKELKTLATIYINTRLFEQITHHLHYFLVEAFKICYVYDKMGLGKNVLDLKKQLEKESRKFDNKKFPDKLKYFSVKQQLSLKFVDEIESINKARNCFVHRKGIVGEKKDGNSEEGLLIKWWIFNPSIESGMKINFINKQKLIPFGKQIILNYSECEYTTYTIFSFCKVLIDEISKKLNISKSQSGIILVNNQSTKNDD